MAEVRRAPIGPGLGPGPCRQARGGGRGSGAQGRVPLTLEGPPRKMCGVPALVTATASRRSAHLARRTGQARIMQPRSSTQRNGEHRRLAGAGQPTWRRLARPSGLPPERARPHIYNWGSLSNNHGSSKCKFRRERMSRGPGTSAGPCERSCLASSRSRSWPRPSQATYMAIGPATPRWLRRPLQLAITQTRVEILGIGVLFDRGVAR
jgi:hypothetical protein